MEPLDYNEHIRAQLLRYIDSVRSLGWQAEQVALGAVVALVALKKADVRLEFSSPYTLGETLRKAVSDFEQNYLSTFNSFNNLYHIPYDRPPLFHFLYEINLTLLEEDGEILHLLENLFPLPNSHSGESVTPAAIAELMTRLIDVHPNQSVFDPCMGSGGFFTAIQNHVHQSFSFWGADKNTFNRLIVKLKAMLAGQDEYEEITGVFSHIDELPTFDVVISNPPIGKVHPHDEPFYDNLLNGLGSKEMTLNFIELGLQRLKMSGKAAFLVPLGLLFSGGKIERIRASWLARRLLTTVIILPAKLLYHTSLRCAILIFENKHSNQSVRLIKADDFFENTPQQRQNILSNENIEQIIDLATSTENTKLVTDISYDSVAQKDFCLIPEQFLGVEQKNNLHLSEHWSQLGNIAEVIQGTRLSKAPEGDTPVIRGRDLRTDKLDHDSLAKKDTFGEPVKLTQKGDILIQRIGDKPAAYLVTESDAGVAVEDTVFIIRFHDLRFDVVDFICQFINSDQVASRINNARSYSVIPTQNLKSIRSLEVPIPDQKVINLVKEMNALEAGLKQEYEKAKAFKNALFNGYNPQDLSNNFDEARFTASALESALKQKDDITYRVRTQYPFPLAYAYRNIYLEREFAGIYERQMKYGEQLLSFLAVLGLCLSVKYCSENQKNEVNILINEYRTNIEKGISPGHLESTLQNSCKILAREDDQPPAQEFSQIWYKSGGKKESSFAKSVRENLVSKLNDYKHHRGPANRHERKIYSQEQTELLEAMLSHVEFLSKWDLIRIDEIHKGWRSQDLEYSASLLKGDHPAFEQIQIYSDANLSMDKLYIKSGSDFVCLYPLISLVYNPQTRREEIFTIDKSGSKSLHLKSFESGTSIESSELRSDFTYWLDSYKYH